jgi:hypothetical protein
MGCAHTLVSWVKQHWLVVNLPCVSVGGAPAGGLGGLGVDLMLLGGGDAVSVQDTCNALCQGDRGLGCVGSVVQAGKDAEYLWSLGSMQQ